MRQTASHRQLTLALAAAAALVVAHAFLARFARRQAAQRALDTRTGGAVARLPGRARFALALAATAAALKQVAAADEFKARLALLTSTRRALTGAVGHGREAGRANR